MRPTFEEYGEMVKKASPPSHKAKDMITAFLTGGAICVAGQLLFEWYTVLGLSEEAGRGCVSVTLIFIAAVLTGLGVFDRIAKHAGAGTLVPITGFANAVVAPAIEYKKEGQITGIGAKMFTIAGPVLVFGMTASVLYGLILWIVSVV